MFPAFRAFVHLSQNNYTEAHASFIEVLKIDPKNPVVGTAAILQTVPRAVHRVGQAASVGSNCAREYFVLVNQS